MILLLSVQVFVTRDAKNISNLLAFIRRHAKRGEPFLKKLIGGEGGERFYLIKTKSLEDKCSHEKSLLEYIVDNGARMMKQREELIDLVAEKIERVEKKGAGSQPPGKKDEKITEKTIIENLKIGLPSSVGLTKCIKMTEEKFRWSWTKSVGMTALCVVTNMLGLSFWIFDLYTDSTFVNEMFTNSQTDHLKEEKQSCRDEFSRGELNANQFCSNAGLSTKCLEFHQNQTRIGERCGEIGPRFDDLYMFTEVAVYALFHCISPFFFLLLAGWAQTSEKSVQIFERLFGFFPPLTRWVKFWKERKKYKMRAMSDFKKEIPKMEADIVKYEDSVNISTSVEAATEASPQFFFQTVYLLPNLIINLMKLQFGSWLAVVESLKGLISFKMVSIVFSFTSVARSNYSIR